MTSEYYNEQWYTDRWNSLPLELKRRAVNALQEVLPPDLQEIIQQKHAEYGHDWIHHLIDTTQEERDRMDAMLPPKEERWDPNLEGWPKTMSAHHGWGTAIRNVLRDAGIGDNQLPAAPYENGQTHQNWDDYYIAAVEAAVGLR